MAKYGDLTRYFWSSSGWSRSVPAPECFILGNSRASRWRRNQTMRIALGFLSRRDHANIAKKFRGALRGSVLRVRFEGGSGANDVQSFLRPPHSELSL